MKKLHLITGTVLAAAIMLPLSSCGGQSSAGASASAAPEGTTEVTVIQFGCRQDYNGISYIDDDGNLTGYDIEVMQAMDELLPDYEFEYDPVGQEALLTGLETKQYIGAIGGFFWNEDRAAAYLFPEHNLGASLACLLVRGEDVGKLVTLEDLYDQGKKLVPISPISGTYGIVTQYNSENPDKAVDLGTIEWNSVGTEQICQWIHDGVYDANVQLVNGWDIAVKQGINTYGCEIDRDQPFSFVKSYTLFAQGQEDFLDVYDDALQTLIDNGTISEIYTKYNGFDFLTLQ